MWSMQLSTEATSIWPKILHLLFFVNNQGSKPKTLSMKSLINIQQLELLALLPTENCLLNSSTPTSHYLLHISLNIRM